MKFDLMTLDEVYLEPFDVVKFLSRDLGEKFLLALIERSYDFFNEYGVSPIIEQQKFGVLAVDYFFMVNVLIEFICDRVDESLHLNVRERIKRDFVLGEGGLKKNGDFLISVLKHIGFIVPLKSNSFFYIQIAYFTKNMKVGMIHSGVSFSGKFLDREEYQNHKETLKDIGSKDKLIFVGMGSSVMSDFLMKCANENIKILSWKNLV